MKNTQKLFRENTGFGQILDHAVRERPDHMALVTDGVHLTYRELGNRVDRLAAALERDGVKMGDPVAVISRNCWEFLVIELALFRLGAVPVKINWRFSPAEILCLLKLNEVRVAFVRYERRDWGEKVWRETNGAIRFFLLNADESGSSAFERYLADAPDASAFHPRPVPPDAPLLRIHTSGTTGTPKCVIHTHGKFLEELRSCLEALDFGSSLVYQMVSQLFHVACIGAYMVLATGGTLVLLSRFEPREYLTSIQEEKVTGIGVLPVVLKKLLDRPDFDQYDLSTLKRINYSTCPMPPTLLARAMEKLHCKFYQSYGMTEMSSVVTVLRAEDHFSDGGAHLGSVGLPIPGAQVRILAEDGSVCPTGTEGEIVLRGPGQMQGYFRAAPEVNAAALRDGWYHSKDMGRLDENGYLYVCGRKDDLIISGGENIYPKEVVDVLMRLENDIAEAAVYGVPDPEWGERVVASVVPLPQSRLTAEDLIAFCRDNMPHYKAPKQLELVRELPKSATGKVLVRALAAAAAARMSIDNLYS